MVESVENVENQSAPQVDHGLLKAAQNDFVSKKLDEDLNAFDLGNRNSDNVVLNAFTSYLKTTEKYTQLAIDFSTYSPEQQKTLLSQLRQLILQEQAQYNTNKNTLEDLFFSEYDFSRLWKKKIQKSIKEVSKQVELADLVKNQKNRLDFLKKHNISEFDFKDENQEILDDIFWKVDHSILTDEQKQAAEKITQTTWSLSDEEFFSLLSIFPLAGQMKVLKYFNKSFKLSSLIEAWIIDSKEARNLLLLNAKKTFPKVSKKELEESFNDVSDFSEIYINTTDIWNKKYKEILWNKDLLKKIFQEISDYRADQKVEIDDDIYEWLELDSKWNIHQNFLSYLSRPDQKIHISETITSTIGNFKKWWYIQTTIDWVNNYYYIEDIDLGATVSWKAIKIKNLASQIDWKYKTISDSPSEVKSYKDIYKLLVSTSQQENTSLSFISEKKYDDLDLDETDPDYSINSQSDLRDKIFHLEWEDSSLKDLDITKLWFMDRWEDPEIFRSFTSADDNTNTLIFSGSGQKISYSDFFYAYKKWPKSGSKFIMEKTIDSLDDAISSSEKFSNLALHKSWKKLVPKDLKNQSWVKWITYFTSWTKGVYIDSISDSEITYSFWTVKETVDKKWVKGKKFTAKYKSTDWTQFTKDIEGSNLKADVDQKDAIKNADLNEGVKKLEEKWSMFGFFSKAMSLEQIMQWWTMFVDALTQHFERWDKLKAAKFAEQFRFLLPEWAKQKLTSNTEKETKQLINDLVDELKWKATSYDYVLKNILENPNAQMWEVYAWMKFMIEKTWSLKWKLWKESKYNWSFPWYEKLGWKIWDPFYEEEKARALRTDWSSTKKGDARNFTEEKLVEGFLRKKHIQSQLFERAWKDFWNSLNQWIQEEMEDWENKTSDENTISDKVDYFVDVLWGNEQANAIWSLKKLLWKNTANGPMNMAPFILVASNIAREMDTRLLNELVGLWMGSAYWYLFFATTPWMNNNFNDSILQFLKDKWKTDAHDRFKILLNTSDLKEKVNGLHSFWKTYWDPLLLNFISLKDGHALLNKDEEPYWSFVANHEGVYTDWGYSIAKDQLDEWNYDDSALASVWAKLEEIRSDNSWGYWPWESRKTAWLYFKRLNAIKENSKISYDEKKMLFVDLYDKFEDKCNEAIWQSWSRWKESVSNWKMVKNFNSYWLIFHNFEYDTLTRREFLNTAFEHFMNSSSNWSLDDEDEKTSATDWFKDHINEIIDEKWEWEIGEPKTSSRVSGAHNNWSSISTKSDKGWSEWLLGGIWKKLWGILGWEKNWDKNNQWNWDSDWWDDWGWDWWD